MTDTDKSKKIKTVCPICGKSAQESYYPFCSKRCADIDLYHWLNGNYFISGNECEDDNKEIPNKETDS